MKVGIDGFVPERLKEARDARRIPSQAGLARVLQVAASTVSRWEDGAIAPEPEMLDHIAITLGVRVDFFLRDTFDTSRPIFFRSQSSTLVRDLNYQRAQMRWLKEITHALSHYVDFPKVDIPDVLNGAHYKQLRDEDLERIASDLRAHWGIGDGPCENVVAHLEGVGAIVASIEMGTAKLDGLCSWSEPEGRPHILLANDKMSFARRQMDAAHEMAHAILHRGVTEDEFRSDLAFIETQAFRLGSAFLMPASSFAIEARVPSLTSLMAQKDRWKVSIKAQIKRLSDLDIIPEEFSRHLYKVYSAKGWSREEPFDRDWPLQEPKTLANAIHLIVDSGVRSKRDLMGEEFVIRASDVESLCNLTPGWLSRESAEIIPLRRDVPPSQED
jgi:Zn-dependent peptidase ImmA (M78 family)/transcriptional regulator with XRE-family HTH domain